MKVEFNTAIIIVNNYLGFLITLSIVSIVLGHATPGGSITPGTETHQKGLHKNIKKIKKFKKKQSETAETK